MLNVDVVYALSDKQYVINLDIAVGSSVEQAIQVSGILNQCTEIDFAHNKVGIFGHFVELSTVLHQGDRVEIYRPLIADPKELRRQRALQQKK